MAMSFVARSVWAWGTGTVTPALPTGTVAGDYVVIDLMSKYDNAVLPAVPTGWDDLGVAINSGRPTGIDNGNLRTRCFGRIWQNGDSLPALAPAPNNVSGVAASTYRSATGLYAVSSACVADNSTGTPLSIYSGGGLTAAGILHVSAHLNGDAPTIASTSINVGTPITSTNTGSTALGTDARALQESFTGFNATPTFTVNLGGTTTNAVGTIHYVAIREVAPVRSRINIVASNPAHRRSHTW